MRMKMSFENRHYQNFRHGLCSFSLQVPSILLLGGVLRKARFWVKFKYLMCFCVRKLTVFLGFYFNDSLKPEKKYYPKYRHLYFKEHLKINIFYTKK